MHLILVALLLLHAILGDEAGLFHTCQLQGNSAVFCTGDNAFGQLGIGTNTDSDFPVYMLNSVGATAVQAMSYATCIILNDRVRCTGRNNNAQLGAGAGSDTNQLGSDVAGVLVVTQLIPGSGHMCAISDGDELYCWGKNLNGQCGSDTSGAEVTTPDMAYSPSPIPITTGSAGYEFTCIVVFGGILCSGDNSLYQCGSSTTTDYLAFTSTTALTSVVTLASGMAHTCALTSAGAVYCWGSQLGGLLGNGVTTGSTGTPYQIPSYTDYVHVVLGNTITCVAKANSIPKCWGTNTAGAMGTGGNVDTVYSTPINAFSGNRVAAFAGAGAEHLCIKLYSNNTIACSGGGTQGEIGDGLGTDTSGVPKLQIVATFGPTLAPTKPPTKTPTLAPTLAPTKAPTLGPTYAPTTLSPTTLSPTLQPTLTPSSLPSKSPTSLPTRTPTSLPTRSPTALPTTGTPTLPPTGTVASWCPVWCAMYTGELHLLRSKLTCHGTTVHSPTQHCAQNVTGDVVLANSLLWTITVNQDVYGIGTQVRAVTFTSSGGSISVADGGAFPTSAYGFQVSNIASDHFTVTYPGSDMIANVDCHTFNALPTERYTVTVCSSEFTGGYAETTSPCPPADPIVSEDDCDARNGEWEVICDHEFFDVDDPDVLTDLSGFMDRDEENYPNYINDITLK